jgi:hypothetical protein
MDELERVLKTIMVKIIVQYPDGLERIHNCLMDVIQAGLEMTEDQMMDEPSDHSHTKH